MARQLALECRVSPQRVANSLPVSHADCPACFAPLTSLGIDLLAISMGAHRVKKKVIS